VNGLLQLQLEGLVVALGQIVDAAQGSLLELVQLRGLQTIQVVLELAAHEDRRAEQQAGEEFTAEARHYGGIYVVLIYILLYLLNSLTLTRVDFTISP